MRKISCVEICAGAGGQAIGLERAGFEPEALVEIDRPCCDTLRHNRSEWNVVEGDLKEFKGRQFKGIDLLAGGVPCPPFSKAGKQLGEQDDRDLFPEALRNLKLLAQVRRAKGGDQIELLKWLVQKYPKKAKEFLE